MRAIRAVCVTRFVCALSASAVVMTSCTSMHRVPVVVGEPQPSSWRVNSGDEVSVTMRDGRTARFTVQTVEPASIIARDGTRYDLTDIVTVERRAFSGVRTTFLVGGILGGAFLFAVAAAMASYLDAVTAPPR